MKVRIVIRELVLDGFDYHDHPRIAAAMKAELVRIIEERGVSESLVQRGSLAALDARSINVPHDRDPRKVGIEIARSVSGRIAR